MKYWIDKAGNKVFINKAADQHLFNALSYFKKMERALSKTTWEMALFGGFNGEQAQLEFDRMFDEMLAEEMTISELCKAIEEELNKRTVAQDYI